VRSAADESSHQREPAEDDGEHDAEPKQRCAEPISERADEHDTAPDAEAEDHAKEPRTF